MQDATALAYLDEDSLSRTATLIPEVRRQCATLQASLGELERSGAGVPRDVDEAHARERKFHAGCATSLRAHHAGWPWRRAATCGTLPSSAL